MNRVFRALLKNNNELLRDLKYFKTRKLLSPATFVSAVPPSFQPYLKLSRVDRPIGTWLLYWPATWGLTLGTEGIPSLELLSLFGAGALAMRGAGCTINDIWDRDIDGKVSRTAGRPLAAGQVTVKAATGWLAFQLSTALLVLLQLKTNPCFYIALGSLGLVFVYPLAKRVTNWPQGVLGLTFNTGVLMGYGATSQVPFSPEVLSLYTGAFFWTLIYDTIYAHQDREEDALLGLGSTARLFGDKSKIYLTLFAGGMISSLTTTGVLADLSWPYFLSIAATGSHLTWQIWTLDINNGSNCAERFLSNKYVGLLILLGLSGSYLLKNSQMQILDNSIL